MAVGTTREAGDTPFEAQTDLAPGAYLSRVGGVFAAFDTGTQDSGNVSHGLEANGRRWFVKTAGDPADPTPFLPHEERVALLLNARRLTLSQSPTRPSPPCRPSPNQPGARC